MKVERWASPKSWLSLIQLFHTFSPSLNPQPTTTQLIPRIGWKSEVQNSKSLSSPISQPKFKNHKDFFNGKSSSDAQKNHFLVPPSSSSSCTWTAGGSRLVPHHWSGFSWQDGCYQEMLPILTYLNLEPKWRFPKIPRNPFDSRIFHRRPSSYWVSHNFQLQKYRQTLLVADDQTLLRQPFRGGAATKVLRLCGSTIQTS